MQRRSWSPGSQHRRGRWPMPPCVSLIMGGPEERSHKILECMLCSTAPWPCVWPRFPFLILKYLAHAEETPPRGSQTGSFWPIRVATWGRKPPETPGNPRKPQEIGCRIFSKNEKVIKILYISQIELELLLNLILIRSVTSHKLFFYFSDRNAMILGVEPSYVYEPFLRFYEILTVLGSCSVDLHLVCVVRLHSRMSFRNVATKRDCFFESE